MNYRFLASLGMTASLLFTAMTLQAQMTVTGRVTSGDQPVRGAAVAVSELGISARTNAEGQYSFIIRATQIRGQTVTIVARHSRYGSQSLPLVLAGGSVELDFVLTTLERAASAEASPAHRLRPPLPSRTLDSTRLGGMAGPSDVASALAGQFPGLLVTTGTAGGSSPIMLRGFRSLAGPTQPLVVVDGIALDYASSNTAAQRFGLGGFDYGTSLQDIALDDIASITLLNTAAAVPLYGSRAANGVLMITTKQGGAVRGMQISTALRFSGESPDKLPAYQNRYGQGLGGQFEFFDGQGGGINDAIDQSWGPALDGQPIAQASLTETRRPDVRYWLPHASGVRDYFDNGRTIDANVALNVARSSASARAALNARNSRGVTPNAGVNRLGLTLSGVANPIPRLTARANLQVIGSSAEHRPGTGFDEINPVAGFTRLGRQVDLDALRSPANLGTQQINWIYTTRNNPFFQAFKNSNDDARSHILGGGLLTYGLGRGLTATLSGGTDDTNEDRLVDVADGWIGDYPTALGRRDFSAGGTERRTVKFAERTVGLSVSSSPRRWQGVDLSATAGAEKRTTKYRATAEVADAGALDVTDTSDVSATAFHVLGTVSRADNLTIDAGARVEQSSSFRSDLGFAVYPTLALSYDAARGIEALRTKLRLGTARVRTSWWRAGNEITRRTLLNTYAGGGTATSPTLGIPADSGALPERTTGMELSTELASPGNRVAIDFTLYSERSREVVVAAPVLVDQTAEISNTGFEAQLRAVPVSGMGRLRWEIAASFAHNKNEVTRLGGGIEEVPLAPDIFGATLLARTQAPLGVILGTRYLRDSSTKALVLRNGLPIPDATGLYALGSSQPDWTASLRNKLTFGLTELAFLFDARMGGRVFSATNLWGSYAGTLESTLEGREAGLTIAGIDTVTRSPNAVVVSAEDYFHALGAIHEAWVYDASYWKLREARLTHAVPLRFLPGFREHILRLAIVGRNLITSANAPNIDPETALSTGVFQGFEMGQLPGTRSVGFQLTIAP